MGYKVKRIRVGTSLVRPSLFPFYYDFRGKTWSQCQNDGWYDYSGNTLLVNSDGIYYTSWAGRPQIDFGNAGEVFNNAKKITFSAYYKISNGSAYGMGLYIGTPSRTNNSGTWFGQSNKEIKINNTAKSSEYISGTTTGWRTQTIVLDLINKTYSSSGDVSYSGSLTTSDISSIKNLNTLYLLLDVNTNVATVSVNIE